MTTDESDAEDERLLQAGELDVLFARHYDDLVAVARMRTGADRAADLVQSALLRTLRELRRGHRWSVPFRVVVHQHLRWAIGDLKGEHRPSPFPDGWDVPDHAAEEDYLHLEGRLVVEDLLSTLADRDRTVMRMRFVEGCAPADIAARLQMTRNAVDQALWRGRRAIREAWPGG